MNGATVLDYDRASNRAYDAACTIRRYVSRAINVRDSAITKDLAESAKNLADRLEAIVTDFGLDT